MVVHAPQIQHAEHDEYDEAEVDDELVVFSDVVPPDEPEHNFNEIHDEQCLQLMLVCNELYDEEVDERDEVDIIELLVMQRVKHTDNHDIDETEYKTL